MEQQQEGEYRPRIQENEQQRFFRNSIQDPDLMTIDQCETMRELDDLQLVGPPPPPPLPPPASASASVSAVATAVVGSVGDINMVDVEVRSVVKAVEVSTVKRKRGRPPKIQGKAATGPPPLPRRKATTTTEDEEDVCFICFDGGSLVLCDRRGCPKAYHPSCIKRDESFFRSKAKWNCGWHICSSCQKASHYMCYTCTFSLCRGCTKDADYVCVRGNKGFCGTCMRTIMLIENITLGNTEPVQVDFDDKTSWEYLFKIYWIFLKGKLCLTVDELTKAKNPWKGDELPKAKNSWKGFGSIVAPKEVHSHELCHGTDEKGPFLDNCYGNVEANHSKRRKTTDQPENLSEQNSVVIEKSAVDKVTHLTEETMWATKELLEFVSHMRNGDTSVVSQFDVQALLLDYIKRNNLRDPRQKSQIICDSRLKNLFGKPRVGHFEMLKLLEYHFHIKEKSAVNDSVRMGVADAVGSQLEAAGISDSQMNMGNDRRRKTRKKMDERGPQVKLNPDEYAAIDVHNINLLYLKRNLMENLMDDTEKFHEKVVGSFVRIRIPGGDQKQDMYRLVQVVGTSKVVESYKVGSRTTDVMLEILNLDKKEAVSIDGISNQEFSEDECRRLRQSIKCGLIKRFKVGEIQEKALALQPVKVCELLEAEVSRLNHLRDRASEKGHRKDLRECVEKLDLLQSPKERQRRMLEIPIVHVDPNMDPSYGSEEDAGESTDMKQGDCLRPRNTGFGRKGLELNSPLREGDLNDVGNREQKNLATASEQSRNTCNTFYVDRDGTTRVHERVSESKWWQGGGAFGLNNHNISKNQLDPSGLVTCDQNSQAVQSESHPGVASAVIPSALSDSETEKLWHYQDPYGKVQGPFAMMQLRKWSTSGLFPPELRVWRIDKKQDDSIFLIDALIGQCSKEPLQLCNRHLLPQEATAASNDSDKKVEHGLSQGTDAAFVDSKKFNHDLKPVHKDETINANADADDKHVGSNSLSAHSSTWATPVDVAITKDGQAQNSSQRWSSHPSNADEGSHKTTDDQTKTRETEKRADSEGHSSQSSGQNWRPQPIDSSSSGWDPNTGGVSMAKSSEKSEQNQEIMVSDLPSPTPKQNHKELKGQAENKLSVASNAPVQDSGPSWSTASSLVVDRQLPEVAGEWGGYSSAPAKPSIEEWDSNLVSASSLKPTEGASDHAPTPTSGTDKLTNSSPSHPAIDTSSWQPLVPEPNEFCSLVDESVSDLLAEVEAMESLGGLPSPTSKMSCGGQLSPGSDNECFSPIEPFSPALDPGKSDSLSSTSDIQMPSQLTAASVLLRLSLMPCQTIIADEPLATSQMPSQLTVTTKPQQLSQIPPQSIVPDQSLQASQMPSRSTLSEEPLGLWHADALDSQKSFSGHSSSSAEVEGDAKPSEISVNQWDNKRSEIQPMASSVANHGKAGSDIQASTPSTVSQLETGSDAKHPASSKADTRWGTVRESTNLNQGGASQGSTNMVWETGHGSIQQQASTTSAISTGNIGGWGSQPRYGGDNRFSGQRDHQRNHFQNRDSGNHFQNRDSGYGRDRSSWNRQATYGNGGGSFKAPGKGQRVCKFYESGYCKKGASCSYLHP